MHLSITFDEGQIEIIIHLALSYFINRFILTQIRTPFIILHMDAKKFPVNQKLYHLTLPMYITRRAFTLSLLQSTSKENVGDDGWLLHICSHLSIG